MGLEMKPSKTRVAHTLEALETEPPGFDFLGFEIRQYPVGKYHSGTLHGRRLGFKTLIQPSKEAIKRHREALRAVVLAGTGLSQAALIGQLNPKIRGWSRYYRSVAAKKTLNDCDYHLFPLLLRWAKRRHTRKPASWIRTRYWRTMGQDHWRFATSDGLYLSDHAATAIQRHVKVKGTVSPFDGNLLYWAKRLQQSHPLTKSKLGALLHKQQGKCRWCELYFTESDLIEIDHITTRSEGVPMHSVIFSLSIGTATISDMQRSMFGVLVTRAILLRSRMRGKLSCPVLKAGRRERSLLPSYQNRLHWRRDVTLREDDCQVRKGEAPRVLAVLNSFLLALLVFVGVSNVPSQMRTFGAYPWQAVRLLLGSLLTFK